MTIAEKWSWLFHHTLQTERTVAPSVAEEALILIRWAFDKYQSHCRDQGYQLSADLAAEKDAICDALSKKAKGNKAITTVWPVTTLNKWEFQKPFHEALGSRNLKSGWDPFFKVAKRRYGLQADGDR